MSTAAQELLVQLETLSPALGSPLVRALHLPPLPADGSRRGEFAALELDDGSVGLAYVLLEGTLARLRADADGWQSRLAGRPALDVARAVTGAPGLDRTVGWAAAHALAHSLARRVDWAPPPAGDSLAGLAPQPVDHLGLVGLFGPLMDRLVASGARITVLELRADLAGRQPGYDVTLDPAALASCNKVLSTGTLLLNDTLDAVLAYTHHAERVALVGPTVSGLPDVLFSRGVHVVGGTWIEDAPAFVDALRDGQDRGVTARKFTLERGDWPGWQELLARLI